MDSTPAPPSIRWIAGILGVLLGTFLLITPMAAQAATALPLTSRATVAAGVSLTNDLGLTPLPVFVGSLGGSPGERPAWLDDPGRIEREVNDRLAALGSVDLIDWLWGELSDAYRTDDNSGAYPYNFGEIDVIVRALVTPDSARAHRDELNDLAGLLMIHAQPRKDKSEDNAPGSPAAAYSILNRLRTLTPATCPMQLNLAFAATLRQGASEAGVTAESEKAAELCGDDPTPLFTLGWFLTAKGLRYDDCGNIKHLPSDLLSGAISAFRRLQEMPRAANAGRVGEAGVQVLLAEEARRLGVAPFLARAAFRRALLLVGPRVKEEGGSIAQSIAGRAQLGLGYPREASELLFSSSDNGSLALKVNREALARALEQAAQYQTVQKILDVQAVDQRSAVNGSFPDFAEAMGEFPTLELATPLASATLALGCGGGSTGDVAYIPKYREDSLHGTACTRSVMLAGMSTVWLKGLSRRNLPSSDGAPCIPSTFDAEMAADLSRDPLLISTWIPNGPGEEVLEAWVTVYRYLGLFEQAQVRAERWVELFPSSGAARDTLGEVRYLRGDFSGAAKDFERAAEMLQGFHADSVFGSGERQDLGSGWSTLRKAQALERQGSTDAAATELRKILQMPLVTADAQDPTDVLLSIYAHDALGVLSLKGQYYDQAIAELTESLASKENPTLKGEGIDFAIVYHGSQENNLALALAKAGRNEEATKYARLAVAYDPANPVFLETLAFSLGSSDPEEAIARYRTALEEDPTLYSSWNNLGVLLVRSGRADLGEEAFRRAVGANDRYAIGWFNLGTVLRDSWSPVDMFRGHGALARAAVLDSGFRGEAPSLRVDDEVYSTGLDLSKPVSPTWQFARGAHLDARPFAAIAFISGLLRLVWALLYDEVGGRVAEWLVRRREHESPLAALTRLRLPPVFAAAATLVIMLMPAVKELDPSPMEVIALSGVIAALIGTLLVPRWLLAPQVGSISHFASLPAIAAGVVGAGIGVGFAPVPCLNATDREVPRRVRWSGPICLAGLMVLLFIETWTTELPLVRVATLSAVTLLSSALIPVPPMDGGYLHHRSRELAIGVALIAVSAVLSAGLV